MSYQNGPPKIVTDGLVLMLDPIISKSYPGSGNTIYDLSGNGNNGIINGANYWSDGKGSFNFDGVDDYVSNTSTTGLPTGSSDRTIQLWAKLSTEFNNLVQLGTGGGGNQVYIFQYSLISGVRYLFTDGVNGANNITISGDELPSLNVWNNLVFSNSGQTYYYYINGIQKKTGTWPVNINTIGQKYLIGRRDDSTALYVNGNIAQTLIYSKALTPTDILQNYNATKYRFGL